jgi:hypothetical protein
MSEDLVAQVPGILKSQNSGTGRFGEGIWVVIDQNALLPLAAAWSYQDKGNGNPTITAPRSSMPS